MEATTTLSGPVTRLVIGFDGKLVSREDTKERASVDVDFLLDAALDLIRADIKKEGMGI